MGCKHENIEEIEQLFRDGTKHIRVSCKDCGIFRGWKRQNNSRASKVALLKEQNERYRYTMRAALLDGYPTEAGWEFIKRSFRNALELNGGI